LTIVDESIDEYIDNCQWEVAVPARLAKEVPASTDGVVCCPPVTEAPISLADAAELAPVLAALGDPVRLRLLSLVAAQGEVCSCHLEGPLGKSQPTISHHTRVLAEAGLITGERRGKWTWWTVVPERLALLRRLLGGQ
jgi:ArsR family transcriptional regulator